MRIRQWDRYGLSYRRMAAIGAMVGAPIGVGLYFLAEPVIGEVAAVFGAIASLGFAYAVLSEPKRSTDRASIEQAREAPALAAASSVHFQTTGSKSRTMLMLSSEQRELSEFLYDARRKILLGVEPAKAVDGMDRRVSSDSVARVVMAVTRYTAQRLEDEGSELEGMVRAASLREETKTPVFIAIAFFTPIMLMLFATVGRDGSPAALVTLVVLQVVVLDLVFSFFSRNGRVFNSS